MRELKEESNSKMKKKQENGITLIALVITVVVLLILATISIVTLTGDNGIINQASDAKIKTEISQWEERIETAIIAAEGKHRNTTIDDVIQELIDSDVISDANQVDKETGTITTNEPQYDIEGKLDDYIESKSTEITVANYGDRVNYVSKRDSSLIWRIFYSDTDYVYLISSKSDGSSTISSTSLNGFEGEYTGSENIDTSLQYLNKQWFNILGSNPSKSASSRIVAYLMDQEVWDEYKDSSENASYAIGGPTLELFVNSYNATSIANSRPYQIEITDCTSSGYVQNTDSDWVLTDYNKGIYNNGTNSDCWIASPDNSGGNLFSISVTNNCIEQIPVHHSHGLRPVVIIPKDKFIYSIIEE